MGTRGYTTVDIERLVPTHRMQDMTSSCNCTTCHKRIWFLERDLKDISTYVDCPYCQDIVPTRTVQHYQELLRQRDKQIDKMVAEIQHLHSEIAVLKASKLIAKFNRDILKS